MSVLRERVLAGLLAVTPFVLSMAWTVAESDAEYGANMLGGVLVLLSVPAGVLIYLGCLRWLRGRSDARSSSRTG